MGSWFTKGIAHITLERPNCVSRTTDRPTAGVVARTQAKQGSKSVTNLLHHLVKVSDFEASVIPLLDGTRDRESLTKQLTPPGSSGALADVQLDETLQKLAHSGLLSA